ncbi:MAG: adenylate/guanylate cyclase domain-containing protein [Gallionellaceae bacterium]
MEERGNKTIICSVFFLDIVEYSKKSVSGQISQKERFNAFLSAAIRDVPVNDRIILDTGDGAAISFLGDVEDALRAALSMRTSLLSEEGQKEPALLVRMGINLGPVRLVRDINGQPNIVGDGINVAQRVMGFADAGQILVSRSYHDAASRLSQQYAGMFSFVGSRTDKHVREHDVYSIGQPGDLTGAQKASAPPEKSENNLWREWTDKFSSLLVQLQSKSKVYWDVAGVRCSELALIVRTKFQQASQLQKGLYIGIALISLLLFLLTIKLVNAPEEPVAKAPVTKESDARKSVVALSPKSGVSHTSSVSNSSAEKHAKSSGVREKKSKQAPKIIKKKDKRAKADKKHTVTHKKTKKQSLVLISVKPWGEVYLDGKMVGVSPPLTKLKVSVGPHVIELKNANFPVYKRVVSIKTDKQLKIQHKFAN